MQKLCLPILVVVLGVGLLTLPAAPAHAGVNLTRVASSLVAVPAKPVPTNTGGVEDFLADLAYQLAIQLAKEVAKAVAVELWSELKESNNKPANTGKIEVNRQKVGEWEVCRIEQLPTGRWYIRFNSGYLCSEQGGGGSAVANRTKAGDWEAYTMYVWSDKTVSFVTDKGYYLSASAAGLNAQAKTCGSWECFTVEKIKVGDKDAYALKANNGMYVSAQN